MNPLTTRNYINNAEFTGSLFGGHVFYNFQIETGYRIKFHWRRHQAHFAHTEVTQDLRTGTDDAVGGRFFTAA